MTQDTAAWVSWTILAVSLSAGLAMAVTVWWENRRNR